MSRKRRSKSKIKSINRKSKILFIKGMTIFVSLVIVVAIGILVTKPGSKYSDEIVITKQYQPGKEIASSLDANSIVSKVETNSEIIVLSQSATDNVDTIDKEQDVNNKDTSVEQINTNKDNTNQDNAENNALSSQNNLSPTSSDTNKTINESINTTESANIETSDFTDVEIPVGLTEDEEIQFVKDKWVDEMIHENQSEISQSDLSQGATIYNQLDTGFLFGLAKDGLTEEEKQEAMTYLEANLSEGQIETAMALFNKYIGLVN